MKKRIKYIIIILVLLLLIFGMVNAFINAREKKLAQEKLEKDKVAEKYAYKIIRDNNKYKVEGKKLKGKTLNNIYYDGVSVYLYYTASDNATLLKYNIESNKVVVLFENNKDIYGDFKVIGKYFKLGNKIYNNNFKIVRDYNLGENEYLFPSLNKILFKKDDGVYVKNIKDNTEEEVIKNTETEIYTPKTIKNDGKFILLEKQVNDKKYIVTLNKNYEVLESLEIKSDNTEYNLIDDVPYLLEKIVKEETTFKLYNANTNENVFDSSKINNLDNYIFDNSKFIANDGNGNIKLIDYITNEEKILIKAENNRTKKIANKFMLANDKYSLILTLENESNKFYIFYL